MSSCLGTTRAAVILPPSRAGPELRSPEITSLTVITLTCTVITGLASVSGKPTPLAVAMCCDVVAVCCGHVWQWLWLCRAVWLCAVAVYRVAVAVCCHFMAVIVAVLCFVLLLCAVSLWRCAVALWQLLWLCCSVVLCG